MTRAWAIAGSAELELEIARKALEAFKELLVSGAFKENGSMKLNEDAASVFLDGIDVHLAESQEGINRAMKAMRQNG